MSEQVELTRDDKWFLEKAYLLKPEGGFNLASIALFDDDIDAHDAFDSTVFQRLVRLGYILDFQEKLWEIGNRGVDVVIFQMTPLGIAKAEELLDDRLKVGWLVRLHSANWAMWGGIAAMIAAFASIAGAVFAFMALKS